MQKGYFLPLLGIIAVILILGGVYYLSITKNQSARNHSVISSQNNPQSTQSISQDETSTWKTYKFQKIGILFKLPPKIAESLGDLKEIDIPNTTQKGIIIVSSQNKTAITPEGNTPLLQANSYNPIGLKSVTFDDLIGYSFKDNQYQTKYASTNGLRIIVIPSRLIMKEFTNSNGVNILKLKNSSSVDTYSNFVPMSSDIGALINNQPNPGYPGIVFQMNLTDDITEAVFDQILSTFKFTN
ncbi:MAG: hypothetical protein M1142_06400 [Patescibacteria group bacterium]|nr:hypothetical protein [Patescibacteria group bacterium]